VNNSINNLSPLDGRYSNKVSEITKLFSEKALIQKRFIIEIEWLLFVLNESFFETIKISKADINKINKFKNNFDHTYARKIKSIENKTNHDVKAVEYFIKKEFDSLKESIIEEASRMEKAENIQENESTDNYQDAKIKKALNEIEVINEQIDLINKTINNQIK